MTVVGQISHDRRKRIIYPCFIINVDDSTMLPDERERLEVSDNVKVVVRCRPLSQKEMMMGCKHSVTVDETQRTITVNKRETPNEPPKTFTFDTVFGPDSKQPDVYNLTARPIVDSVLEGYNGTIFAYGQTGTGKTFTMEGVKAVPELRGIIPNSFAHIFNHIANAEGDTMFLVRVSYLEIYNEEVRDLLGKDQMQKLEMKESTDVGVYIKHLSAHIMKNAEDMDQIMTLGHKNRSVGATKMNEHSSRSHAIFTITIECSEKGMDGNLHVRMGKLHLVDLAGSERQSKTGATGQRLKEATKINLSLSNLGNVISALVDRKSTHVPYRNSKLTFLLQDSLGGNCKTMMCTNVGPADYNYDETICTLRYANRAKNIKNKAVINEDPKDALIRQLQKEIEDLKRRLKEGKESSESEGSDSEDMDEGEDAAADDGGEGHSKQQGRSVSPDQMTELQEWKVQKGKLKTHNKVHTELDKREKDLLKARKEHQHQLEKLFALKKMVIGVDLLAKLEEQLKLLEKSNNELDERWQKKQQLCGELEEIEITDLQWESQRENVRQRRRNLGLLTQTSDKVIPQEYQKMIRENAQWNEELGRWQLKHAAYTGNDRKRQTLVPDKKEKDPFEVYYSYTEESLCQSLVRIERPKSMTGNRRRLSRLDTAIKHLLQ